MKSKSHVTIWKTVILVIVMELIRELLIYNLHNFPAMLQRRHTLRSYFKSSNNNELTFFISFVFFYVNGIYIDLYIRCLFFFKISTLTHELTHMCFLLHYFFFYFWISLLVLKMVKQCALNVRQKFQNVRRLNFWKSGNKVGFIQTSSINFSLFLCISFILKYWIPK